MVAYFKRAQNLSYRAVGNNQKELVESFLSGMRDGEVDGGDLQLRLQAYMISTKKIQDTGPLDKPEYCEQSDPENNP